MKTLGVLGGMGPAATVAFLARVQALTPAKGDADHIRVVMDMNPQVPDRNIRPGDAEAELGAMARRLVQAGAQVLAMPCNTAHAQAAGIRAAGVPFIDMIAATVTAAQATGAQATGVGAVGVLATGGGRALYAPALQAAGMRPVLLEDDDQARFMALIYAVKAGDVGPDRRAEMRTLGQRLLAAGAGAVVAGCTEVPLLLDEGDLDAPLIDSAEVLARACVEMCGS
ncbi:aspartate/glutamate racemase family protein [Brevundimonas balnearis]|uniref:Aspartate/glutamate racemase family protein n=1 Tax=Brevundimonas balnearis TaxID=1572858 RepID=A0ABV6R5D3_9CAUL